MTRLLWRPRQDVVELGLDRNALHNAAVEGKSVTLLDMQDMAVRIDPRYLTQGNINMRQTDKESMIWTV